MASDYFVVPRAQKKLVEKAIGGVYQVGDKNHMVVCTAGLDWLKKLPIAVRFVDDGNAWSWTAYAKGKQIAAGGARGVTGKLDDVAKLLRLDAAKLQGATSADTFRKLVGFSLYNFTPATFEAAVDEADGFGEMDAMEKFVKFIEPVKKTR